MFKTLRNAWKIEDLRKKMIFTLIIIVIFRLGVAMPVPFLDPSAISSMVNECVPIANSNTEPDFVYHIMICAEIRSALWGLASPKKLLYPTSYRVMSRCWRLSATSICNGSEVIDHNSILL